MSVATQAQQLPKLQKGSIYLIDNVKIDGQNSEFDNSFQAFNKATDCFYTIANDDKILYLSIQIRQSEISSKVLNGGITFSIGANHDKRDTSFIQITFPVLDGGERGTLMNLLSSAEKRAKESENKETNVSNLNQTFTNSAKTIKTKGIVGSSEQVGSIYNDKNILVAAHFDSHVYYTYEIAIPLTCIKVLGPTKRSFKYNVQLNSPESKKYEPGGAPPAPPVALSGASSTDFWHEYTLAAKR